MGSMLLIISLKISEEAPRLSQKTQYRQEKLQEFNNKRISRQKSVEPKKKGVPKNALFRT